MTFYIIRHSETKSACSQLQVHMLKTILAQTVAYTVYCSNGALQFVQQCFTTVSVIVWVHVVKYVYEGSLKSSGGLGKLYISGNVRV